MRVCLWSTAVAIFTAISLPGVGVGQERFTLDDNLVHVPAVVDGKIFSAVLDSGTSQVLLDSSAAARLELDVGISTNAAEGPGGAPQPLYPLKLEDVKFGPIWLHSVSGFAINLEPLIRSAGFPVEAILGEPLFRSHVIRVDYRSRKITITQPSRPFMCKTAIPISIIYGVPVAEVTLQTDTDSLPRVLHLVIDLGTRHFAAMLGGKFLDTEDGKQLAQKGVIQEIGTGTGGKYTGEVATIHQLEFGVQKFPDLRVALTPGVQAFESGVIDGSLGVPLWKTGAITFDYPHRRVCMSGVGPA